MIDMYRGWNRGQAWACLQGLKFNGWLVSWRAVRSGIAGQWHYVVSGEPK